MAGETIFESGPGLRNWIAPESADGFGRAVAARVGGRLRVGRGSKVSEGINSDVNSGVGLASGCVGEANSGVGEMEVVVEVGNEVEVGVSVMRTSVGNKVDFAGTQAVKKNNRLRIIK